MQKPNLTAKKTESLQAYLEKRLSEEKNSAKERSMMKRIYRFLLSITPKNKTS